MIKLGALEGCGANRACSKSFAASAELLSASKLRGAERGSYDGEPFKRNFRVDRATAYRLSDAFFS